MVNTPAYCRPLKSIIIQATGANVIKLLHLKVINFHNELVFVPGRAFQPSLLFASKAGAYPSGAPSLGLAFKH
jgi:hypothetical protein